MELENFSKIAIRLNPIKVTDTPDLKSSFDLLYRTEEGGIAHKINIERENLNLPSNWEGVYLVIVLEEKFFEEEFNLIDVINKSIENLNLNDKTIEIVNLNGNNTTFLYDLSHSKNNISFFNNGKKIEFDLDSKEGKIAKNLLIESFNKANHLDFLTVNIENIELALKEDKSNYNLTSFYVKELDEYTVYLVQETDISKNSEGEVITVNMRDDNPLVRYLGSLLAKERSEKSVISVLLSEVEIENFKKGIFKFTYNQELNDTIKSYWNKEMVSEKSVEYNVPEGEISEDEIINEDTLDDSDYFDGVNLDNLKEVKKMYDDWSKIIRKDPKLTEIKKYGEYLDRKETEEDLYDYTKTSTTSSYEYKSEEPNSEDTIVNEVDIRPDPVFVFTSSDGEFIENEEVSEISNDKFASEIAGINKKLESINEEFNKEIESILESINSMQSQINNDIAKSNVKETFKALFKEIEKLKQYIDLAYNRNAFTMDEASNINGVWQIINNFFNNNM